MNSVKLSLAALAIVTLSSSVVAADSIGEMFTKGKVKGDAKAYYFTRDKGTLDADILTTGLQVNYVTDTFKGLKLGATLQSSYSLAYDDDKEALFDKDMYGNGVVASELYLNYKLNKTSAKIGRQFIKTPLVAGSGSRLVKEAFEGLVVVNKDLPKTTLIAGYLTKYQSRVDGEDIAKFEDIEDNAFTIAAINKSIKDLTFTAQYANVVDSVAIAYLEAKYAGKADKLKYGVAAQINSTSPEVGDSSNFIAVKASVAVSGLNAYIALSKTGEDAGATQGFGLGPYGTYYTKSALGASTGIVTRADAQAVAVDANYKLGAGKLGVRYVTIGTDTYDEARMNVYGSYKFAGALKGLKASLAYEDASKDADKQDLWFKANYKF